MEENRRLTCLAMADFVLCMRNRIGYIRELGFEPVSLYIKRERKGDKCLP